MRPSEFLRLLADRLEQLEQQYGDKVNLDPEQDSEPDRDANGNVDDNVGEFTPPLQAKIELLKKANNVKNVYDDNGQDDLAANRDKINKLEAADDDGPFEG